MDISAPRIAWSFIGFSLSLFVPGMDQIQKYLGTTSVLPYIFIAFSTLVVLYRYFLPRFLSKVTEKEAVWLAALTFVVLVGVFAVVYPIADSGIVGGGSDRDDNIDVATKALIRGRYPYYYLGYLGQPTDSLPGALFLALPFVLLGKSAYQNLLWLAVFFIVARSYLRDERLALLLLWAVLLLSPGVLREVVTGGDLISNTIYVLVFMLFMVNSIPDPNRSSWMKWLSAILLGVGLSSRGNFILLLPVVFSTLVQRAGWKPAIKYTATTCVILGGVTVPFFLYDPPSFHPLTTLDRIGQFESIVPLARLIIPLLAGIIAVALSFQRMDHDDIILLRNSAIVQAFLVLSMVGLSTSQARALNLRFTEYGLFFLFFGGLAFWADLVTKATGVVSANAAEMAPG